MRCWRPSSRGRGRQRARLSSNGAHCMPCAPHWARSQHLLICGQVYRASRDMRFASTGVYPEGSAHLPVTTDLPDETASNVCYAYKASLIGAAHRFELTGDGLSWQVGGKSGVWAYADIAAIRLSYRPVSMQSRRFRADIESANRQNITDRKSTRLNSSHGYISYAVFCLKK